MPNSSDMGLTDLGWTLIIRSHAFFQPILPWVSKKVIFWFWWDTNNILLGPMFGYPLPIISIRLGWRFRVLFVVSSIISIGFGPLVAWPAKPEWKFMNQSHRRDFILSWKEVEIVCIGIWWFGRKLGITCISTSLWKNQKDIHLPMLKNSWKVEESRKRVEGQDNPIL